jgi:hypothetical protein
MGVLQSAAIDSWANRLYWMTDLRSTETAMIRIADYLIMPDSTEKRSFFVPGAPFPSLSFQMYPAPGMGSNMGWRMVQTNPDGSWNSDWLFRLELDGHGSMTEYCDEYPPAVIDFPRQRARLTFQDGHEIRWAENAFGTLRPNLIKSSPSKFGSWGTFLCKALIARPPDDSFCDIYMEQKFKRTDRCTYHCRKGHGIFAVTYYAPDGNSNSIYATGEQPTVLVGA